MKLVASKPARLHCLNCDATYSLPAGGSFKLFNELKCPLDEFELLLWVGGPNGKGYPFCPYCYVFPPFRYPRIRDSKVDWSRVFPINNTNFSIEKWRKAVDVINARIHRVLMVWMQLELHHAENAPTVFLFWILLQGQNGNWLVISKKYLFTVFCVWAATWMCLFYFRCQVVIKVCEDANKLSVASSTCPECDARQINVEYRPVNS
jgi:hypothetical protein